MAPIEGTNNNSSDKINGPTFSAAPSGWPDWARAVDQFLTKSVAKYLLGFGPDEWVLTMEGYSIPMTESGVWSYRQKVFDASVFVVASLLGIYDLTAPADIASVVEETANMIKGWLGDDYIMFTNDSGDKVFLSADGTRRVRFDLNKPAPHNNPHAHVEELVNGKWVKSGPIYPVDVPSN